MRRAALTGLVLLVAAVACGSSKKPIPNVLGQRLDVAESKVQDAGYKVTVFGGGAFGVVVESNWTVCGEDPPAGTTSGSNVKLIVDRSCTGFSGGATPATEVPNVVGMNLQLAKGTLSASGFQDVASHDATGLGRSQLVDQNWVVVTQSPSAGTRAPLSQGVDLAVKKYGE